MHVLMILVISTSVAYSKNIPAENNKMINKNEDIINIPPTVKFSTVSEKSGEKYFLTFDENKVDNVINGLDFPKDTLIAADKVENLYNLEEDKDRMEYIFIKKSDDKKVDNKSTTKIIALKDKELSKRSVNIIEEDIPRTTESIIKYTDHDTKQENDKFFNNIQA